MFERTSFFLLSLLVCLPAAAQDTGRLPDGRAYRTGEDGYRLVDQIAELQVANDELRRHVAELETDLEAKEIILKNCPNYTASTEDAGQAPDCDRLVSNLYLRVSRLQKQVDESGNLPPAQGVCNFDSPENPLWNQIKMLESRLAERDELLAALQGEQAEALEIIEAKRNKKLNEIRSQMASDNQTGDNQLSARVQELETELERKKSQLAQAAKQLEAMGDRSARARLGGTVAMVRGGTSDSAEIAAAREEFRRSLDELQGLIFKRKSLYDRLKSGGRRVSVNVQPLETRDRISLDSLRRQVSRLNGASNTQRIRAGLAEIKQVLMNDIRVLNRLS